jgi:radical SAM protein with 4Fe4S-binding SPASM domain
MNPYLESKLDSYKIVTSSECFRSGLIGLGTIELNPTELCSRRCKFCPRHDPAIYKSRNLYMEVDTVNALVSQCKSEGYVGDISIAGFGEPMLHPDLSKIIKPLRDYNTLLITNGDFLTQETLEPLMVAGLKKVIVSCYDGKEAKHKFEKLLATSGIDYFIKELWGDFNTVVTKNDFNNRTGLSPVAGPIGRQCYRPFYKLFIDWNGDALLCSNDWWRRETGFGNINTNTLREIWLGEKFTEIRKELAQGRRINEACKNCNCNGVHIGQDSFDLLKVTL